MENKGLSISAEEIDVQKIIQAVLLQRFGHLQYGAELQLFVYCLLLAFFLYVVVNVFNSTWSKE